MVGVKVVRTRGGNRLKEYTAAQLKRSRDLTRVYNVQAERMHTIIKNSFERARTPEGVLWDELKQSTKDQKKDLGYTAKPLTRTGDLKNMITVIAKKLSIIFGIGPLTPYGTIHLWGYHGTHKSTRKRKDGTVKEFDVKGNTPARPFLPLEGDPDNPRMTRGGDVSKWLKQTTAMAKHYIMTGEIKRNAT